MPTGRSPGGNQELTCPKISGEDALGVGACGQPHRTFSCGKRSTRPWCRSWQARMSPLPRPRATKLRRRVRQLPLCKCSLEFGCDCTRSEQGWCSPALRLLPHVAAVLSVQLSFAAVFSLCLRELSDRGRLERLRPWWQIKEVSPSSSSPSLASSSSLIRQGEKRKEKKTETTKRKEPCRP